MDDPSGRDIEGRLARLEQRLDAVLAYLDLEAREEPVTTATPARAAHEDEALALLRDGRTIEAIKVVREATGLGLKEAKDLVEALERANGLDA